MAPRSNHHRSGVPGWKAMRSSIMVQPGTSGSPSGMMTAGVPCSWNSNRPSE